MKIFIVWILAIYFLVDSILRALRSTLNLGTFMMYCITVALWVYALFHSQIDAFCKNGFGYTLKIIFWIGCAVLLLLMLFVAVSGYSDRANGNEKVVIVLGAGLRGEQVSGLLARRLDVAYSYYREHSDITIVVTGGQGMQEIIPEATAMRRYLIEKGVPSEQIIEENKSHSTEENFAFARDLLAQRGIGTDVPMAFATNAFHCYRAGKYAEAVGFESVSSLPASIGLNTVLPSYMREAFAVLHYWVFKQ